jgi:hypothetical protein
MDSDYTRNEKVLSDATHCANFLSVIPAWWRLVGQEGRALAVRHLPDWRRYRRGDLET